MKKFLHLFAKLFGSKQTPPSLDEVITDALRRKDLDCLLRLAPDIYKKMALRDVKELDAAVCWHFGDIAARQLWRRIYSDGEVA